MRLKSSVNDLALVFGQFFLPFASLAACQLRPFCCFPDNSQRFPRAVGTRQVARKFLVGQVRVVFKFACRFYDIYALSSFTLCQWVDAFNNADAEAIADLYDDKAINHQVANEPVIGKAAIRKMFEQEFSQAKMVCIVENIFEDGQWAILEWRDPLGLRGCGFFQIINDRIVFQRGYWDKLSFLKLHNLPIE